MSETDLDTIFTTLGKEDQHFELRKPKKRNPNIVAYGVEKDIDPAEIPEILKKNKTI